MQENSLNFSDEELVDFILSGDYDYFQILINRYMPYVISVASRYKINGFDTEDFVQEGVLAIFSAVKKFDSSKASFKTFVTICINRAIYSALSRVMGAAKHIPQELITPIDDVVLTDLQSPENILIEKENYNNLENSIKKELSQFEYRVLSEFLLGRSYSEIAEKLSISTKSVDNALMRVRSKIKK